MRDRRRRYRKFGWLAAPLVLALIPLANHAGAAQPGQAGPKVVVRAKDKIAGQPVTGSAVSDNTTGAVVSDIGSGQPGIWDEATREPEQDAADKLTDAGVRTMRFLPFGMYRWKWAIGDVADRKPQPMGREGRNNWVNGETSFGIDEFMAVAEYVEADVVVVLPIGRSTTDDAADLVEYMTAEVGADPNGDGKDWAAKRAENGHPEPYSVKAWEIGNEPELPRTVFWRSPDHLRSMKQYTRGGEQRQVRQQLHDDEGNWTEDASSSDGSANQRFGVYYPPVRPDTIDIAVNKTRWDRVRNLSSAGPDEKVYKFNERTGVVRFGDGKNGKIPTKGTQIRASYTTAYRPGFVQYRDAMKDVSKDADICASWAPLREQDGSIWDYDKHMSFPDYMRKKGWTGKYDCLTIHPYTSFSKDFQDSTWNSAQEGHDVHFLGALRSARLLHNLAAEIGEGTGDHDQYIAASEFGAYSFGGGFDGSKFPKAITSVSHALYMASQWMRYSQLGVPWSTGNALTTPGTLRGVLGHPDKNSEKLVVTVDAVVREQLAPVFGNGGDTVRVQHEGNPRIRPVVTDPHHAKTYAALTSTATVDADGILHIVVVNRHANKAISASVVPKDYAYAPTATATTVSGAAITDYNGPANPDKVGIETSDDVDVSAPSFEYRFPAHSVTVLTLQPRN